MSDLSPHEQLRRMGVSDGLSAAYDLLTDAGYSPEKAARTALAAERIGEDPEAMARKMIRLRDMLGDPL